MVVPERTFSDDSTRSMVDKHYQTFKTTGTGLGIIVDKNNGQLVDIADLTAI